MNTLSKSVLLLLSTAVVSGCGGSSGSAEGSGPVSSNIKFNVNENTRTSYRASDSSLKSYSSNDDSIASACYSTLCISEEAPVNGELPVTRLPAAEHENPEWKALDHHMISPRFHLISGGYSAEVTDEECDGYNKPYDVCIRPLVDMYLYDASFKKSIQVMALAGGPFESVEALSKDLIHSLEWIEPNSRYNQTDKLFMWGQLNARHDDDGKTACGATKHLWEFDPQLADFKLAHIQQCTLDENGDITDGLNADNYPIAIDSQGYIYVPFVNYDSNINRYDIFPQSDDRPVKLDTVVSLQQCNNLVAIGQSLDTGYIFACGDDALTNVVHLEKTAVNLPESIINSGNDYSTVDNAGWHMMKGTGNEAGYMLRDHSIDPMTGLVTKACEIPLNYETEYSENYCVSWENGTGNLVVSRKQNSEQVVKQVVDELVSPPGAFSYVIDAKIDADEQNIYLGIMTTYHNEDMELIDSKISYVTVSLLDALQYPMHRDLVTLELR